MLEEGVDYSRGFVDLRKQKSENKTRFSDEQIRSLEVTFQSHTKLEPTKKAQLANELGLQPRQVAIWFQNKRARWKSKQIEKDYATLLANYNDLASQFESLKKEKQSLLAQLQELKNQVAGNSEKKNHCQIQQTAAGNDSRTKMCIEVKNIETNSKSLEEWLSSEEEEEEEEKEDDRSKKARLLGLDEENELSRILMDQPAVDSSLTSSEDWGSLDDSEDLINQPTGSYLWWDFWS